MERSPGQCFPIPIERLKDINSQDTFYYHFLPYYCWLQPFIQNDNTITQLKAGGFNLIRNEEVVDSINLVYNFFRGLQFATDYDKTCYWDIARKAQALMDLPVPPKTIEEIIPKPVPQNKEIFFQYDKQAIHQLYSMIRNARGSLLTTINTENQYKEKLKDCSLIFKRNITWIESYVRPGSPHSQHLPTGRQAT
jgi:hypothetical protein